MQILDDADNESSKFPTRKWYVINDKKNTDYGGGNEDKVHSLNLKPKSLYQIFVII